MLLEKGADVNARPIRGDAALAQALENPPDIEIAKVLLENGASLKAIRPGDVESAVKRADSKVLQLLKAYSLKQLQQTQPSLEVKESSANKSIEEETP